MKYMLTFNWTPDPETRAESIARFQQTGGLPPAGVKLLGRWTRVDFSGGFGLVESDDPLALAEFALMWSDLMTIGISPIIEDEGLSEVLKRIAK